MIFSDYASTKDYRDDLAKALDVARNRMSGRDFRAFSQGIEVEIARLDSELAEYYFIVPAALTQWTLLFSKAIPMVDTQTLSIRFNSPAQTAPWTGSQLRPPVNFNNNALAACAP